MVDPIYILQNRRLIDEGGFTDLMQRSPVFQNRWQPQKVKRPEEQEIG